jgi:hypothetical protein
MKSKFLICGVRACALAGLLMAAAVDPSTSSAAPERSASGTGTISLHTDHDESPGAFDFSVSRRRGLITGHMEFAAEVHDDGRAAAYPHIVVRMSAIESASFRRSEVTFSGTAWMQGETVFAEVTARDGTSEGDADHFSITCSDSSGILFEGEGHVVIGSIQFE